METKENYKLCFLNESELISEIKKRKSDWANNEPFYFRKHKKDDNYTLFNKVGKMVSTNYCGSTENFLPVNTYRGFCFSSENTDFLIFRLACLLKLPTFRNKRLYKESKIAIQKILKES